MSIIAILLVSQIACVPYENISIFKQLEKDLTPLNPRPLVLGNSNTYLIPPFPIKKLRNPPDFQSIDSVIKNDFLCNDDIYGGCGQRAPKILGASNASFIICWYEFRDGNADIWFQRFDSAGNLMGVNERVNTDVTIGWQGDPAGACYPNGRFILTWEDRRQIGNSDIFAQRFTSDGTRLGDNFRLNDSFAAGDQCISSISIVPNQIGLAVWDDRRHGLTGDIYAQFLNADGSLRGNNFRVNDDPLNYGNQYEPDISYDDSNRFIVTWMDGRDGNWNIYAQRFYSNGERIGNNFRVTHQESIQFSPKISCSPEGYSIICWNDRRRNQWDVYAQIYDPQGQAIGENFRVNNDNGSAQQLLGDVAANRFGEFIVVWTDNRNGNDDVFAQRFDLNGIRLGSEFKLNDDVGTNSQNSPTVTPLPDGGYWIAWTDARNGDFDIYAQRISREGEKIGTNFRVNDDFGSSHQRISSIGLERQNNTMMLAWEDERNGNCDIYASIVEPQNNHNNPNFRINDDPIGIGSHYYPSVAGGKNRFLVTWYDSREGGNIYAQYISATGNKIGNNFLVNEGAVEAHQWYPFCAMDTGNRSVIVWMDNRNREAKIYARLYDINGNPTGPEFRIGDSPDSVYSEAYASVAMNPSGYWVTAWMDYRDGDANIYCQLFKPNGERIGINKRLNSDEEYAYQGWPACAIDENRNIAIAWEDTRNGSYDVYLQWLDSLGNFIGENERINETPTGVVDCYSPSCAFDQNGRLVVIFNDERETPGNPQIYCQRFRPDRTRIGHNQKVNAPNLFPANIHWTVGQSVVTTNEYIAFSWTENRRHKGWDVYAKITDWNLIGINEVNPVHFPMSSSTKNTVLLRRPHPFVITQSNNTELLIFDKSGCLITRTLISSENYQINTIKFTPGIYFLNLRKHNSHISYKYKMVII